MKWILAEMNIPFRELNINITRSGVFRFGWIPLIHRYHRINNRYHQHHNNKHVLGEMAHLGENYPGDTDPVDWLERVRGENGHVPFI